jgi:LysR family glycine cleavage system transcriptional activator
MPSLTELVAFEAVARFSSFTKAAEELSLTQGAISKQVRQLEGTLGLQLFTRLKHQLEITDDGRTYLNEIRPILARLERSTTSAVTSKSSRQTVNCAVLSGFSEGWLAQRLPRFVAAHPDITLNFSSYRAPFDFGRDATLDAAIHVGRANWPGTVADYLFDEVVVPVASPAYCERLELRTPADLERATLIHHADRLALWPIWCGSAGLEASETCRGHSFDQYPLIAAAAEAGLGIALVPQFLVAASLGDGRLVQPFARLPHVGAYYLVVPHAKARLPAVASFRHWLAAEVEAGRPPAYRGPGRVVARRGQPSNSISASVADEK